MKDKHMGMMEMDIEDGINLAEQILGPVVDDIDDEVAKNMGDKAMAGGVIAIIVGAALVIAGKTLKG